MDEAEQIGLAAQELLGGEVPVAVDVLDEDDVGDESPLDPGVWDALVGDHPDLHDPEFARLVADQFATRQDVFGTSLPASAEEYHRQAVTAIELARAEQARAQNDWITNTVATQYGQAALDDAIDDEEILAALDATAQLAPAAVNGLLDSLYESGEEELAALWLVRQQEQALSVERMRQAVAELEAQRAAEQAARERAAAIARHGEQADRRLLREDPHGHERRGPARLAALQTWAAQSPEQLAEALADPDQAEVTFRRADAVAREAERAWAVYAEKVKWARANCDLIVGLSAGSRPEREQKAIEKLGLANASPMQFVDPRPLARTPVSPAERARRHGDLILGVANARVSPGEHRDPLTPRHRSGQTARQQQHASAIGAAASAMLKTRGG